MNLGETIFDLDFFKITAIALLIIFVVAWLSNQPQLVALTILGAIVLFIILIDIYIKKRREGL